MSLTHCALYTARIKTWTDCACFPGSLIAMRLLIGLFEAGFYPTCVSYLSFFYTRFDLAIRIAVFYGQYAIAGAFAGAIC